jgi:ribosomal protein S12 methylthiotransferase accessory factor
MSATITVGPRAPLLAPDAPDAWDWAGWCTDLPYLVAVSGSFDAAFLIVAHERAQRAGRELLPIRIGAAEALIGPPSVMGGEEGCAGCAYSRNPAPIAATAALGLQRQVAAFLTALSEPLAAGELVALAADGTMRRHRIRRTPDCAICGEPKPTGPPPRPVIGPQPAVDAIGTRGGRPFDGDPNRIRRELFDRRFGPVDRLRRKGLAAFAMTEARVSGSQYGGYGRGRTYRQADLVAVLEAYERSASIPHEAPVVRSTSRAELGDVALDPTRLGTYTPTQLASPLTRVRRCADDTPIDWVWGHRLDDGRPMLVPAEVGFYRYAYENERVVVAESSSGSALGSSYPEAVLHSLIELAERDAFLLAWHRAQPLPEIDPASVRDGEARMLADTIRARGYDLHLLAATADIPIPVVWALAVHREHRFPATFTTAGAGPDPVDAIRGALWELGQLVVAGRDLDPEQAAALHADPWTISQLEDHIRINALPERIDRVTRVLGGPCVTPDEAFPGWPGALADAAAGDVTGALRFVEGLYAAAGLTDILVVDQSTSEHRRVGLTAVKAVVPGIVPMCFGHAHQRLNGLPRLAAAVVDFDPDGIPFDPHPFP